MKCLVDWCENEAETDDDECFSHWRARVAGMPATGGDEDGEVLADFPSLIVSAPIAETMTVGVEF